VGSFESGDGALALARKTEWQESLPGFYTGLGQRLLTTDLGDLALMDVRRIDIVAPESSEASDPATADATP
jgi:type VI secretion system protein ImpE